MNQKIKEIEKKIGVFSILLQEGASRITFDETWLLPSTAPPPTVKIGCILSAV
jgi:hypothetical protein